MKVTKTALQDALLIEPEVHRDDRGYFLETWNAREFAKHTGVSATFVQDNHAHSAHNVLRGLHYQIRQPQGKLVRVISGEVFDVTVDLRKSSLTFGRWMSVSLSADNKRMLWIPEGFAHGYLTLSESSDLLYKTTAYYDSASERCIAWNDPDLGIQWPLNAEPVLAARDRSGTAFRNAELFD